eukprot:2928259-Rhodomonas_salina.1
MPSWSMRVELDVSADKGVDKGAMEFYPDSVAWSVGEKDFGERAVLQAPEVDGAGAFVPFARGSVDQD